MIRHSYLMGADIGDIVFERVRAFIEAHRLIAPGERVLLALSAGKDSMTLFDLFLRLRDEIGFSFNVFHLNHMVRGADADADEAFVRELAQRNGIAFHGARFDFANELSRGESFEEQARRVRYALLDERARANGCARIATAHNRDDQAETVLMRILAGTGVHGLAGMAPARGAIIRPLLDVDAREAYEYLRARGIEWREDESNRDLRYRRNYIRHALLPEIRSRFPDADAALLSLAAVAREYRDMADELAAGRYGAAARREGDATVLPCGAWCGNPALFRHVIASALRAAGKPYVTAGIIGEIERRFRAPRANQVLYRDARIAMVKRLRDGAAAVIITPQKKEDDCAAAGYSVVIDAARLPARIALPAAGCEVLLRDASYEEFAAAGASSERAYVAIDDAHAELVLRSRRPGDRIALERGSKKIKDLMIENKLDNDAKRVILLLVVDGHIAAYLPGFTGRGTNRVAAGFRVSPTSARVMALEREGPSRFF